MERQKMLLEVCIDSVESAIAAERGGAKRVELCANLLEGGVTPSAGLISAVRRRIAIDLFVIIRPRGGDFCYTDLEFEVMQEEINHARRLGADGVVLGLLDKDACVDIARTQQLVELAGPLPATFHRAIDMTPDLLVALEGVVATGASRVLTSGGAPKVANGMSQIAWMVEAARGRIGIMPGGGISAENIVKVAETTGATEFHSSVKSSFPSPVQFRKKGMKIGCFGNREFTRFTVREECVRTLVETLHRLDQEQQAARHG